MLYLLPAVIFITALLVRTIQTIISCAVRSIIVLGHIARGERVATDWFELLPMSLTAIEEVHSTA